MKKTFLFLFFLCSLSCFNSSAQKDSIRAHQVYFNIGGQTSCFLGDRYIMPDTNIHYGPSFTLIGFTRVPTSNIFLGFNYQYLVKNKYILACGLYYNDRRFVYKSDSSNLAKFKYFHPDTSVYKFDIHKNNFEIMFSFGYTYKKFGFFFGTKILLTTYEHKKKYSLNGNTIIEHHQFSTILGRNFNQQVLYPEILVSYTIKLKKISPVVYIGLDDFIHFNQKNSYSFNILYGIKIPIIPNI